MANFTFWVSFFFNDNKEHVCGGWCCRETGEEDVRFKVLYCGICHSDLHSIKNEWGNAAYPMVPGYAFLFFFVFS